MTATNCVGGIAAPFTRVIDGNGAYFSFKGSQNGNTFTGSADLAHGFRGTYGPTGTAFVSNPPGTRDTIAAMPCIQSVGPNRSPRPTSSSI